MASSSPRLPGFLRRSLRAEYSNSEDEADDLEATDQSPVLSSSQQPEQRASSSGLSSPEPSPVIQGLGASNYVAASSSFNSSTPQRASLPPSISPQPVNRQSSEPSSANSSRAQTEGLELHRQRSASVASTNTSTTSQVVPSRKKTYRETQFEKIFAANVVSMNDLKTVAWNGIPVGWLLRLRLFQVPVLTYQVLHGSVCLPPIK
jgi:hypothetical protein